MRNVLAVIPARFASTRLPGKPLIRILSGEPMIAHVVRQTLAAPSVSRVLVATDHAQIAEAAVAAGAEAVMTDSDLPTGTDRVAAALRLRTDLAAAADVVVNVQGDEPLVQPSAIDLAAHLLFTYPAADIATLSAPLTDAALLDPSRVKVVCGSRMRPSESAAEEAVAACCEALYFSRAPIGVQRETLQAMLRGSASGATGDANGGAASGRAASLAEASGARLHVGLYAFRPATLQRFVQLPPSRLEQLEQLEQLRALGAGMRIAVGEVGCASAGIDTIEDVRRLETAWSEASEERRAARTFCD